MLEILRRYLNKFADKIDSSGDLAEAVSMSRSIRYDIVVLDLRLKDTDEYDSLAAIPEFKENKASVIVCSGIPDPGLKEKVLAAGASAFVAKDGSFGQRALLLATNIAIINGPGDTSIDDRVEILRRLVTEL